MMLDSHAHLDDEKLDSAEIIKNMKADNLSIIINAGTGFDTTEKAIKLSKNDGIFAMVGIHPENILEIDEQEPNIEKAIERIKKMAQNSNKVVAVGEIGLEYFYLNKDYDAGLISAEYYDKTKKRQIQYFISLLKMADELNLPIALHIRDAYEDCYTILKENINLLNNGVLFHCYSGDEDFAKKMLDLIPNCYFAFGGAITFSNQKGKIKEEKAAIIRSIPKERLLLETDCPYLTPEPFRGKEINQPKYIKYVYLRLAEILNMTLAQTEDLIMQNAKNLYRF